MADEQLEHILSLAEKATPEEWWVGDPLDDEGDLGKRVGLYSPTWGCFGELITEVNDKPCPEGVANAELICALRNLDLPKLVAEIRNAALDEAAKVAADYARKSDRSFSELSMMAKTQQVRREGHKHAGENITQAILSLKDSTFNGGSTGAD